MPTVFNPSPTGWPVTVLVGQANAAAARSITRYVDLATLRFEESGNNEPATCEFEFIQESRSVPSNAPADQFSNWAVPEGPVLVRHGQETVFQGFVRQLSHVPEGISRRVRVAAYDVSTLLDRCIVRGSYVRAAGETDKARIQWLLTEFGDAIYALFGNLDFSMVQTLDTSMPRQRFGQLTLRQAIEQVLAAASPTANYYMDPVGRLHTFSDANPEGLDAPYRINTARTLASNECAPEDLSIEWDTSGLINIYKVRGRNAAGTETFFDPVSFQTYGARKSFIDGPDCDTFAKAQALADAALADTKDPLVRGRFSVQGTSVTRNGDRWRPGQKVYVTSAHNGLLAEPYRIVRVATTYLSGTGDRRCEIEFGGLRRRYRTGGSLR